MRIVSGMECGRSQLALLQFQLLDAEAKSRFIDLLLEQFNSGAEYKGRILKWDTVIEQKTGELNRFLMAKSREIGFIEPCPVLERKDTLDLRNKILSLTQEEARYLGIERSTLHYLRKNARRHESFRSYSKTITKLYPEVS